MTAAAFKATYSDWKVIKGRKVVQVVFELPLEAADEAYQVLGGMPIAANEAWCAIARLHSLPQRPPAVEAAPQSAPTGQASPTGVDAPPPSNVRTASSAGAKRQFVEMMPSQQAGMLCSDQAFRKFLIERHGLWGNDEDTASQLVCELCHVSRKRELTIKNAEWLSLVLDYRLWQREAEVVPA